MKIQGSQHRRTVVIDIETASLSAADEKGALDALTGPGSSLANVDLNLLVAFEAIWLERGVTAAGRRLGHEWRESAVVGHGLAVRERGAHGRRAARRGDVDMPSIVAPAKTGPRNR